MLDLIKNLILSLILLLRTWSKSHSLIIFNVDIVLKWSDELSPSWVVSLDTWNGVKFGDLNKVLDLEFLKFQIRIESAIVELTEETHGVFSWQVFLLAVIDTWLFLLDLWLINSTLWLDHLSEMFVVWGALKSIGEDLEILSLIELLTSVWVEMT